MEDLWALAVNEPIPVPEHLRPKHNPTALKWPVFFPGGVLIDPSMPKKRKRTAMDGEQDTHSVKAQPKPLSNAKPNTNNNKKVSRSVKQVAHLEEDIDPKTSIRTPFFICD